MENLHESFDTILTLDFGSQYTHLITRRLRELNIYSELLPCTQDIKQLSYKPKGIILSGGPYSVYDIDAPHVNPEIFDLGIPILGICYGLQEIAWHHGKNVIPGIEREYGLADVIAQKSHESFENKLFQGFEENDLKVWMSHGDKLGDIPGSFRVIAATKNAPFAGIAHETKPIYGIQFHPEVTHTPRGTEILRNFAVNICAVKQEWTMDSFITRAKEIIRSMVGDQYEVLGAVSGGVDSTVAAKIMHDAIGDRFHAILVDNGCMRINECEQVREILSKELGINLTVVDATSLFLDGLRGIHDDPEAKRKFIGETFIDVFEAEVIKLEAAAFNTPRAGKIKFFLQGTLYPDVIESVSFKGPSATIKTHHNVGGLPKRMTNGHGLKLIEPLRELFKDEVREIGRQLGISEELVMRHPFPGPGIAIRILGEVTPDQVAIVRKSDSIFIEEIRNAGLYNKISQAYAALLPVKAVGVMGDKRVHQQIISLRAVQTIDYMTANIFRFDWNFLEKVSTRICNEVEGVCRVVYDMTSKPPGTIEME